MSSAVGNPGLAVLAMMETEAELRREIVRLREEVSKWKDAWHDQRAATGKMAWEVPAASYLVKEEDSSK